MSEHISSPLSAVLEGDAGVTSQDADRISPPWPANTHSHTHTHTHTHTLTLTLTYIARLACLLCTKYLAVMHAFAPSPITEIITAQSAFSKYPACTSPSKH